MKQKHLDLKTSDLVILLSPALTFENNFKHTMNPSGDNITDITEISYSSWYIKVYVVKLVYWLLFPLLWQNTQQKQLKKERDSFWLTVWGVQSILVISHEGMWGTDRIVRRQEPERAECWWSARFLLFPFYSVWDQPIWDGANHIQGGSSLHS